jgi:hypothetical protein
LLICGVILCRIDDPETVPRLRGLDDCKLVVGEYDDRRPLALGKMCGERPDQGGFKFLLVLPDRRGAVIASQDAAGSNLGISANQIDGNSAKRMVAVDIGDVQTLVGDLIDHLRRPATQDNPPRAGELGPGHCLGVDLVELGLIVVRGLVPIVEMSPGIEHVVARDALTMP